MNITRHTLWAANTRDYSVSVEICQLNNEHLANVIRWVNERMEYREDYPRQLLDVLRAEADSRGLTKEYLNNAPYPHDLSQKDYIKYDGTIATPIEDYINFTWY